MTGNSGRKHFPIANMPGQEKNGTALFHLITQVVSPLHLKTRTAGCVFLQIRQMGQFADCAPKVFPHSFYDSSALEAREVREGYLQVAVSRFGDRQERTRRPAKAPTQI
ncbi:hypothetical protein AA0482_1855 [Acetobacter cibinongensis NRIC 0482]|nr:hypothetical protein AA0482_1855 [Acetobacter cibinongensis NRIC 0482]